MQLAALRAAADAERWPIEKHMAFVLAVVLSLLVAEGPTVAPTGLPVVVHEALTKHLAASDLELLGVSPGTGDELRVARFSYRHKSEDWPYGSGVVVYASPTDEMEWLFLHPGDFGVHSVSWVDLNGDSRDDLYFLAGAEDVFETYAFVRQGDGGSDSQEAFVPTYEFSGAYVSVFDFDEDGMPEFLEPLDPTDQSGEDCGCANGLTQEQLDEVSSAYFRFAGAFDHLNFDYNLAAYPLISLRVFQSVRILQINGTVVNDVGHEFSQHWKWRQAMLENVRFPDSACCQRVVQACLGDLSQRATMRDVEVNGLTEP